MSARPGLPHLRDVLLAVPVGLLVLVTLHVNERWATGDGPSGEGGPGRQWRPDGGGGGPWNWVGGAAPEASAYLLAGLAVAAVALRRWPLPAFGLAILSTSLFVGLGNSFGPILLTVLLTSFTVARQVPLPRSALAVGIGIALLLAPVMFAATPLTTLLGTLPVSAWVVVPFSIGLVRRLVLEARARQRAEQERTTLDAERLRLASEVHDVVGHGLAAIQMQADIALHVADRRPEQAREALAVISRASAEALAELRATLAAIAPETAADESRAATPGLERLADLCARMQEAGIAVQLEVHGAPRALPAAVDVAAYRIVQESLTNVVKHAAQRRAEVRVDHGADEVQILVTSETTPGEPVVEGFGIAGMRRRAEDVGGSLEVAVRELRFQVRAHLPYAP